MSNQRTFVNIMNEFISDNEDEYSEKYSQNNNGKELKYESTSHLENNSVKKEKITNVPNNKDNKNNKNFKKINLTILLIMMRKKMINLIKIIKKTILIIFMKK